MATASNRVNGWLGDQLVFQVCDSAERENYFTVFTLITKNSESGVRVEVYQNGMRRGKSLQLAGQQARIVAADTIITELGGSIDYERHSMDLSVGTVLNTTNGCAVLVAIC